MAAELIGGAFLSSFFQLAFERLASKDFNYHKGLKKLRSTLNSINQLLDDAETKQYQNQNVKNWLDELKHEVYEVDQLLDEIALEQQKSKVKRFFSTLTNPFESRIKDLLDRLKDLAEQKDVLGLTQKDGVVGQQFSKRISTVSLVDESYICGREDEKEKIFKHLLSTNDKDKQVSVISIVGLGGMGKTTLAQLVYNDQRIEKEFELKAWVHVPKSFDVVGLTKTILRSFRSAADGEDLNLLISQLQQTLTGKKYLLVLDDVWTGNEECWKPLLLPLNHGSSKGKIVVTTRDKEVAKFMKSSMLLDLEQLEESDCWSLFVKLAFHNRNVSEYPILESIGKNIVAKCGGLPLAVNTLGNLLQRKFSQSEWDKILETDLWCLSEKDSDINPVLRLSYHNLPSNLKRCFAYCSIFPKGYNFQKDELVKIWMAEGLLKCCGRDKNKEELGNEFFDDLKSISFFQQSTYHSGHLVMHDLINDLAKSESGEFCLQVKGGSVQDICERTRHIWCSLDLKDDAIISKQICKIKGLRSLLVKRLSRYDERIMISNNLQHDIFSKLKYLRMLSFHGCQLTKLSDKIGNLTLLRYLDLTRTNIKSLPDSICELYNLETLILIECFHLTKLPLHFYKLVCLRHLYLKGTDIKKMPKKIGSLNHLQTLNHFVLGEKSGSDIKELDNLNLLQGKLCISGLEIVTNPEDAAGANLKDKKHLKELIMDYSDDFIFNNNGREFDVLEALRPNSKLERLTIENYNGKCFPNWLRGCDLPNLVSLELKSCRLCSHLPALGQLPSLKELFISDCDGIKTIGKEFYDNNSTSLPFRSLEVLKFEKMDNWEEWLCLEGFPLLKMLSIRQCPKFSLSSLDLFCYNSLQELEITGRDSSLPFSLHLFTNLHSLQLYNCPQLESFPRGGLPSNLNELRIWNCPKLIGLREDGNLFQFCSNLRQLVIWNCPKLIASREEWGLFQLNSLNTLTISDEFENVESFPEKNLLPPTLEIFEVNNSSKLRIMNYKGFLHLNSLEYLHIWDCPSLESLPEEGLQLSSLSQLIITQCRLIREKYKKEGGERWHTIRHIPKVTIDCIEQQE